MMLHCFDFIREMNLLAITARLVLAVICGGVIGLEREVRRRSAGFRTHILICMGSAITILTNLYLYQVMHLYTDISRMGAQIVSGLGFIGGGTIIVINNKKIKGLTTAAGLWTCGIIGLAIGAGFYEGAILCTALVLITQTVFSILGSKIPHNASFKILLQYNEKNALNIVMRYCKDQRMVISNLAATGKSDETMSVYSVILTVRPRKKVDFEKIKKHINDIQGVIEVEVISS